MRQQLQRSLAPDIHVRLAASIGLSGSQLWQIGTAPRLLVRPAPIGSPLPGPPNGEARPPELLLYEYVPAKLGQLLRAQGTQYADAAGNIWLRHPPLLVDMQGYPRPPRPSPAPSASRQVTLLRLLFGLLHEASPDKCLDSTLASHTGLPLAAVQRERDHLLQVGIQPIGCSESWPTPIAVRYWLNGFVGCLRSRLRAQRYCLRNPDTWRGWLQCALPAGCHWSGEPAARLLLGQTEAPATYTLYSRLPRPQLVQTLGLLLHARGRIEVLNAFLPSNATSPLVSCVPPLLIYADLLVSPHPGHLALAQAIQSRYLAWGGLAEADSELR